MIRLNRRALLGGAAGGLLGTLGLRAANARGSAGPLFVGCRADPTGRHYVTGFEHRGRACFDLPLPGRGHAMAFHPSRPEMIVFARRPGNFAVAIDHQAGIALHRIDAVRGRHFYGHGAFSSDSRVLFATENDYETGQGIVGLYDAKDGYRRIGEYPAHGIGPHELILMPGGKTLAIANGGIRTHPDQGRAKLNLETMAPSLVFADLTDGRLIDRSRLAENLHQLSIRHMATLADGRIAIAMQYEGSRQDRVPLIAIHDGKTIETLDAPASIQRRMRHYAGSIAVDRSGTLIAVSAPRGNLVTFWEGRESWAGLDGRYLNHADLADGCGVAPSDEPGEFMLTGGNGDIMLARPRINTLVPLRLDNLAKSPWDNHLRRVPLPKEPT